MRRMWRLPMRRDTRAIAPHRPHGGGFNRMDSRLRGNDAYLANEQSGFSYSPAGMSSKGTPLWLAADASRLSKVAKASPSRIASSMYAAS